MIAAILLGAAAPETAVEAERTFAADAQKLGQWTAFRKYAAADALMFVPQPIKAQDFLKGRKDPPVSVFWWPGRSYVSCDGNTAVNTGPWVRDWGKSIGYFTTVWERQADGRWKWIYDAGDILPVARAEGGEIKPQAATCPTTPPPAIAQREMPVDGKYGIGSSKDGTLNWSWAVAADGSRNFVARLWDGQEHRVVVDDKVGPQ